MSRELLLNIANKQLVEAKSILEKELLRIMESKLLEKKKMIAASTFSESANVEEAKSPKDYGSGFLNVKHKGSHSIISYMGNMGSTEKTVAKEFDAIHGEGSFAKIRPHGEYHKDKAGNVHNDASYSYVLKVPKKKFDSELNINEAKSPKDAIKDAEDKASALGKDFAKKTKDGKLPNPPSSVFDIGSRWSVKKKKVDEGLAKTIKRVVTGQRGKLKKKIEDKLDKEHDAFSKNSDPSKLDKAGRRHDLTARYFRASGMPELQRKNPKGLAE